MKKKLLISFIVLLTGILSCTRIDLPPFYQQIVVEGWIEDGEPPYVQLTGSVPPSEKEIPYDSLKDYIIKYARVYVTVDGIEHQLYGTVDRHHFFPNPFVYTSDEFKGELGKTYGLRIEYSGRTVTASTTIPDRKPVMDSVYAEDVGGKMKIYADIVDDPERKNFYKFFIRKEKKDSGYVSSYLAITDDRIMSGPRKQMIVSNSLGLEFKNFEPFFEKEDVVHVKLCSMEEEAFWYWKDYNDIVSFSRNPFLSFNSKIRYNVNGGHGYWAGYGKVEETVFMKDY